MFNLSANTKPDILMFTFDQLNVLWDSLIIDCLHVNEKDVMYTFFKTISKSPMMISFGIENVIKFFEAKMCQKG